MEENLVAQSRSVVVHLSSLEAFIPLGDTLQCCVEAVAQAVLPLLCFPLAAYRHDNNDYNTAAVVAAPPTPLCSDKLVFSVPLVSLNVCASQSDDLLVERPSVLFGVSVHKVFFERSRMGVNEKTLAQVLSITSTVDPAIQNEFVSATAPRGALDAPSQWALYFWYEVSSVEAETRSESSAEGVAVSEQMPSRLVDVIARAHAVKLTVSPQLLSTLNEHVLVHVASGMCRTRNTAVSWVPSRHVKDVSSTLSSSSGGDHHERLIIITHDFCLKADLTLGGRRGSCLRFAKEPIEKGPQNRITVKCINHARVIVSFLVAADGSQKLPIVVDPGITVVFEGVPFVLEHGKVMDYVKLGGRSVFVAPTESVVVVPVGGPLTPSPAAATPSMTLALNNARWYNLKVSLDVSADVVLQLWSKRQTIAVSCEAYARYKLEKNCFEANRGVRDFMDESGEVGLSNVSILCDSGRITKEPTGLVVHVKHHKLKEDRTNAGMTVVRASVPPTGFTLSMGNLRLLLDTYNQLRQGVEHIGSTMRGTTALESAHTKDGRDFSHSKPTPSSLSSSTVHQTPVENSLVWSHEGEVTPLIEFGASAPQMEFILTNDFYKTEATIMLNSFALLAKGNRSLNRMACTASMVVRVSDYPQLQPSREVIAVSSEVAVDYARYAGGGFSLQGALTCPHASVTVPLVTALRLLRCRLDLRRTGIYSFCNKTGIPLLISAVGGAKQRSQEEKNELYSLPLEKLVKANLFHYNQTRFRVIHGEEEEISKQYKNIGALGTEVDLSVMQRGETYRFPLIGGSTGVMDVAMRLDEMKRVVDITTSVEVKNELATYTVCFPASLLEPFVVRPKETRYATLPCLRQPLSLMIGGWRLNVKNSLMTLEAFISAFTLLPEGRGDTWSNSGSDDNVFPRCAYMDDDNTLVVPLTLTEDHYGEGDTKQTRKEANGFGILLVLTRRVALESQPRTSRLLPRYEVELSVCPLATVLNQTGAPLAVTITPLSSSAQVSAAAASTATDLSFVQDQEEFNCFSQCRDDETPMINLTCELANGVRLCSLEPVPLTFRGTTTVGMKAPGEEKIIALVVERTASWKFVVRVAVILVNALSFPVWVYDDSKELVIGQKSGVGLAPGDKLSVTHSSTRQRLPQPNAAVSVCIVAGSNTAKHSQKFACNAPTFSGMLQSVDGDIVRIFKAHRTGGMKKVFTPTPVVRLESMWVFRNKSHTLPLTVRCVGLEETAVIAPRMTMEWTTFAASSAMDPLVQVRYGTDEKELFAWSEVVKLVTLSSSNVPIVMKHLIREENMGVDVPQMPAAHLSLGVRIFTSLRVPKFVGGEGERERFTCLSIAPSRHKNGYFVVDFTLDENIPVVVENRTGRLLQYEQIQNSASRDERAVNVYILQPFVDGVTCFKGEHVTPIMRLTLFGGSERSQSCTIDLAKAATTREAVQTSKHMFVLCTYDYSLQRYYVSVTVDRSLENSLLFQPRYIIHLETFIQSLSLHIASICVPKSETSLQNTPFATLIKRNQLRLGCMATTESTNAELLAALKRSELDVILVQAVGIYSAISINERHYFGRLDVGRLALIDCTTPRPLHPIIVCLDGGEDTINKCQEEGGKPSFSINVHALVPEEEATTERSHVSPKIVTVPLQHLCVNVAPMTLNLADSLLFVLRQAGICVLEAVEQMDIAKTVHGGSEDTSENTSPESSVISEDILIYNCHIGHLMVSRIDLELTITRRSDGKFDPFAGFTMGGRLVPSVERAPLIIGEVERTDVNQCSNSLQGALVSMLWPSYRNQFLLQLYKIVGSLEVLGNPLALMSGWGKGVRSFVVETADMNPLKGARAFLLATTSSTLHSVGLLSRVGSRTAASISWDNDWLEARDENERLNDSSQPSGVLWGVAQGLRGGIEGVVSRPWNGARNAGIAGFCTGIAAGAVGLLTRPVASVLDGFGNTAEFYSKLLQEPDCIPKAHGEYLESERNFYAAAVVPLADPVSATDSKRNSTLTTPLGGAAGCSGGPELLLKGLGPSKTWNATNCEFVSVAMYQALDRGARRDGLQGEEAARFLMNTVGVHNYALHADWESFVAYTTPEEYYTWVHVAFASALKGELEKFAFNSPASVTLSSSLLLLHSRETAATTQEENVDAGVERARNIKNTLGPRDLLKYVSLEHFVQVCSLEEVKHHVAPETIHTKLPQLLLSGVKASLEFLLQGGGHH
ncbi:vacuolar protein sorting-associated protein 13 family protein [Trypanosoma grayi]|uniref:vacuolar protein sorting-associated protein 13 family protein n=1 Tax=Trypanosoma grayi TaxID=71804 RepID=UPI0004F42F90|nr:vacuolar protein sorting-associated protein 13 family protein [Trypanosoma grayi]KEG13311.1 vacuolar protein sorting-associated protein 13 family protein [Trypanosoma grayi]